MHTSLQPIAARFRVFYNWITGRDLDRALERLDELDSLLACQAAELQLLRHEVGEYREAECRMRAASVGSDVSPERKQQLALQASMQAVVDDVDGSGVLTINFDTPSVYDKELTDQQVLDSAWRWRNTNVVAHAMSPDELEALITRHRSEQRERIRKMIRDEVLTTTRLNTSDSGVVEEICRGVEALVYPPAGHRLRGDIEVIPEVLRKLRADLTGPRD